MMYLYIKKSNADPNERKRQLRLASGTGSTLPNGAEGIINFDFGNIYIDEKIHSALNDALNCEIRSCLEKISNYDFGFITADEKETNLENIYLGNGREITARYNISIGEIEIYIGLYRTQIYITKQ